nr:MAG TPA: hypothetical protein [Bacteriophage sp.]
MSWQFYSIYQKNKRTIAIETTNSRRAITRRISLEIK